MQITSTFFINRHSYSTTASLIILTAILGNHLVHAAPASPPVDAGLLQQQLSPTKNRPPATPANIQPLSPADESSAKSSDTIKGVRFLIKHFRLNQSLDALSETQLNRLLADFLNKENTTEDLKSATDKVTNYLQNKGYLFARVSIKPAETEEYIATVHIILGKLSGLSTGQPEILVQTSKGKRLKDSVIQNIIKKAAKDKEGVRLNEVERGLLLINDLPGVSATGTFVRGQETGSAALRVNVEEKSLWGFVVGTDNNGSRYTGAQRFMGGIRLNDPSGYGDLAQLDLTASQGIYAVTAGYRIPLGSSGLVFSLGGNYLHYKVTAGLVGTDARGSARNLNTGLSYPILRSRSANFYIGGLINDKWLNDDIDDFRTNERHIRSFNLNWLGNAWVSKRDSLAYIGVVTFGHLDRDNVASDALQDQNTRKSQGGYTLLRHLARWEHGFNQNWSLAATHTFQLSSKNLDTSEKLYLGGPRGVRAYSVEEAGADQGQIFNLEARWRAPYSSSAGESWTLFTFYDWGQAQLNRYTWNGWNASTPSLPNTYHLQSAGIGLRAQLKDRASVEFLAARAIGNNPGAIAGKNADGLDNKYHLWINAVLQF